MSPTPDRLIEELARGREIFLALAGSVDDEAARWRESPDRWSLVEIVAHLADEEREDFRARTKLTLESPEQTWPPTDPQGWITERDYQQRSLAESLERFGEERTESLRWLRSLENPDWSSTHHHPKGGPTTAGFLLANWVAHDLHHIRQIVRWKYRHLDHETGDMLLIYAGDW